MVFILLQIQSGYLHYVKLLKLQGSKLHKNISHWSFGLAMCQFLRRRTLVIKDPMLLHIRCLLIKKIINRRNAEEIENLIEL